MFKVENYESKKREYMHQKSRTADFELQTYITEAAERSISPARLFN